MCFVPVKCVTLVRFNRYDFESLYDPLGTFEEIALVGEMECIQIVVITYSFLWCRKKKCIQIVVIR